MFPAQAVVHVCKSRKRKEGTEKIDGERERERDRVRAVERDVEEVVSTATTLAKYFGWGGGVLLQARRQPRLSKAPVPTGSCVGATHV